MSARERRERVLQRMRDTPKLADLQSRQLLLELAEEDLEREYRPDGMPKRKRATKKKKADREKQPDNQWQQNLKAWNANNSGWCIPKKGTREHDIVLNYHKRLRGVEVGTPPPADRRASFYHASTPEQLARPTTAEVSHAEIERLRANINAIKQRQTQLEATRRASFG